MGSTLYTGGIFMLSSNLYTVAEKSSRLRKLSPSEVYLKNGYQNPRKRTRIVTLSQHTSDTVRDIVAAVRAIKSGLLKSKRILGPCLQNEKVNVDPNRELLATAVNVDSSTVRRRFIEAGRFARKPIKKQLSTPAMKKKRLDWARKYES
ncbi:hypothetical protein TNCV_3302761 [Trichonephila clavipes]|nr:hypothetical protein TNCV_3302761 [Trichonephila clavipes]